MIGATNFPEVLDKYVFFLAAPGETICDHKSMFVFGFLSS